VRHQYMAKSLDTYLYKAMRKYEISSFVIEVVEEVSADKVNDREKFWISTLQSLAPVGYNLTEGGDGGDTSSSPNFQIALALRDMSGDKNPNYGKLGEASPNYGSKRTKEQCDNLQRGLQSAWDNNPERKELQSARVSGINNPCYGKTPKNAKRVDFCGVMYDSITAACKATGKSFNFIKKYGETVNE
jgi:group I intron endonuclease